MENNNNNENVLTVSQLTDLIKTMLEGTFSNILLKGEISNLRPNSSGHLYFVLKDNDSQISAVMFRGRASQLNFKPKDGMLVQVQGQISVYPPRGNYQIIINTMKPSGAGDIMEMLEERKRRLDAEGLFDAEKRKKLPVFPSTIGVVTSATGAALRDIIRVTKNRNSKVNILVLPAQVQGTEAAGTIVNMINTANYYHLCDVLIVGRGGGSLEDLLPFSDEGVVRAIASSEIPVISAVGHDIDWALSDYAADVRAATPSNAAEIAVPLLADITQNINNYVSDMYNSIQNRIQKLKLLVKSFKSENFELQFRAIEQPYLQRLDYAKTALIENMNKYIEDKRSKVKNCIQILENCNPQTIFDKGYSMVTDCKTGKIIRNAKDLKNGDKILIKPSEGTVTAQVIGN